MGQDFVLDYGGVILHEDELDGESRNFRDKDAAEGIGEGGVDTD